jgi:hypothetical protein
MTRKRLAQCNAATKRWQARNPDKRRAAEINWQKKNPAKMLVRAARRRAKGKGIACTITWKDISPLPTHCPVFGYKLNYGPGRGLKLYENKAAASLDRIRNSRGYVPGNVIVISLRANLLKGQATLAELRKIAVFFAGYGS